MYDNPYRKNPESGKYIIDIALDDYMDFFHEWDNAAFLKRDINPELAKFLDMCSEDIPIRKQLEIIFTVENDIKNESKEKIIIDSYNNYYTFYKRLEKKKINAHLFKALALVGISICFIFANEMLPRFLIDTIWADILLEGLMIGGWVFMWEAFLVITFQRHEHVYRSREIRRFLKTSISFKYGKSN